MNEEEKANREYRLYEFLRRASLDDSILQNCMAHPAQGRCSMRSSGSYDTKTGCQLDFYTKYRKFANDKR